MSIRLRHTLRQFRSEAIEAFLPRLISCLLLLALVLAQPGLMRAAGRKPEELVARHVDSLGTPAARAAVKSRVVQGTARFKILVGGGGWLEGKAAVVSEEGKVNILLKFHTDYQGEQFISDGNKSYVAATRADHRRSSFGEFVKSQSVMLQEGLLGGALSTGCCVECCGQSFCGVCYDFHVRGSCLKKTVQAERQGRDLGDKKPA